MISKISKLNTSGLTFMAAAALAIGLTRPVVQTDSGFGSFGSGEESGMLVQSNRFVVSQMAEKYSMNIDPAAEQQLGERTFNELTKFFQTAETAIETKDMTALMALYSDHYRNGDLDKKSVEQAWQRIFARVDAAATLNNLRVVSVSADKNMVVLKSNGLLVGVPGNEKWPVTIDNWNNQDQILVKETGEWKLIGIYGPERKRLWFDKPMHPLI